MHAFNKDLKDSGVLIAAEGLAFPIKPGSFERERTGSRLRMEFSRNPRSSLPATGLSRWKVPSKLIGSPRALRRLPDPGESRATCLLKCGL
jgi:hypothetical protein